LEIERRLEDFTAPMLPTVDHLDDEAERAVSRNMRHVGYPQLFDTFARCWPIH
jgi:hypothetical protein